MADDDPDYLEFTSDELNYLLEVALIENKPQFVNLILENDFDMRTFLTKAILTRLYHNQLVTKYSFFLYFNFDFNFFDSVE